MMKLMSNNEVDNWKLNNDEVYKYKTRGKRNTKLFRRGSSFIPQTMWK